MLFISRLFSSTETDRLKEKNKDLMLEVKNLNMQLSQVLSELQEAHSIYNYKVSELEAKIKLYETKITDQALDIEILNSMRHKSKKSLGEA